MFYQLFYSNTYIFILDAIICDFIFSNIISVLILPMKLLSDYYYTIVNIIIFYF